MLIALLCFSKSSQAPAIRVWADVFPALADDRAFSPRSFSPPSPHTVTPNHHLQVSASAHDLLSNGSGHAVHSWHEAGTTGSGCWRGWLSRAPWHFSISACRDEISLVGNGYQFADGCRRHYCREAELA